MIVLPNQSIAASLGESLGTGLGAGLQALAQHKLQNIMAEKQRQSTLAGLGALGYKPEEAQAISYLDPQIQQLMIKNKINQPGEEAYAKYINQLLGGTEPGVPSGAQIGQGPEAGVPEGIVQQRESAFPKVPERLSARQLEKLAPLALQKQQHEEKRRASAYKETKEERKSITEGAKAARENDMRLGRIKELDKKGNIQNPLLYSVLKKVGIDIPALRSADTQELEKLSNDFLKTAKNVFGSRLTNYDVQTFLQTVPNLAQTKEGRARVIRNLELFNQGALVREKAMRDILRQHNNVPPLDLESQVEERAAPELDKISQKFKTGESAAPAIAVGSKLDTLPDPKSVPVGTQLRAKNGSIIENTGTTWKKVK